jgi:KUP system potassium uptake protein
VDAADRVQVEPLAEGFWKASIDFGFMEEPNVPEALELMSGAGLHIDPRKVTYFLGRETLVAGENPSLKRWRVALYMWLASNALSPARFYQLPPGRVVELGTQVSI